MTEPTLPPSAPTRSRAVRKLNARQPLPRRLDRKVWHVLDVGARPFLRLSIYLGIAALAGWFVVHLYNGDRFRLEEIRVAGGSRISPEQVRNLAVAELGIDPGVSMFAFSARQLDEAVEKIPAVRSAQVSKRWPRFVDVTVEERVPVAIFVSRHGSYVVDETGLLFATSTAEDLRNLKGPILTGWDELPLERGTALPKADFSRLRTELAVMERANAALYNEISEARWDAKEGLTLVLGDGALVYQGFIPMEQAGPVIETMLAESPAPGMRLDHLRLTRERSVAVAWRPEPIPAELLMAERD